MTLMKKVPQGNLVESGWWVDSGKTSNDMKTQMKRRAFQRDPVGKFSKKNSKTSTVCSPAETGSEWER